MKAKFRYAGVGLALLGLAVSAAGCRKDLCYDHDAHSPGCRALVTAVWEREWERDYGLGWLAGWDAAAYGRAYDDLRPDAAEGIAMVVYGDPESRTAVSDEFHLSAGGGKVSLKEGSYSLLFYNDDTEFIVFNDMASLPSASATTRTRTRGSYSEHHAEERTVNTPDMLYGHFVERYGAEMHLGWEELPVKMQPLVYTYLVRYRVEYGRQHIALARGALAGMAESVYLQDGRTGDEAATLLYDCTLTADGAEACVVRRTLLPRQPLRADQGGGGRPSLRVESRGHAEQRQAGDLRFRYHFADGAAAPRRCDRGRRHPDLRRGRRGGRLGIRSRRGRLGRLRGRRDPFVTFVPGTNGKDKFTQCFTINC